MRICMQRRSWLGAPHPGIGPLKPAGRLRGSGEGSTCRRGYFLLECLVYIALVMGLLGVGYVAFYRCVDNSLALHRYAEDVASALHAGERWRADVRAATSPPRVENTESAQLLHVDSPRGEVTYRFATNGISRRLGEGAWLNVLPRVKASTMSADPREHVTAWRWELELRPRTTGSMKPGRIRPLFTFSAVPTHAASK